MGNLQKYECRNPVQRVLIQRFLDRAVALARQVPHRVVLDAGCGEGFVAAALSDALPDVERYVGLDLGVAALRRLPEAAPGAAPLRGDLTRLPCVDDSADLVVATEVLEHLADPGPALAELVRVTRGGLILSVPREPFFAGLNLLRAKNVRRLGSDPDHRQHWTRAGFLRFLRPHLEILQAPRDTFPWTLVLARVRG